MSGLFGTVSVPHLRTRDARGAKWVQGTVGKGIRWKRCGPTGRLGARGLLDGRGGAVTVHSATLRRTDGDFDAELGRDKLRLVQQVQRVQHSNPRVQWLIEEEIICAGQQRGNIGSPSSNAGKRGVAHTLNGGAEHG